MSRDGVDAVLAYHQLSKHRLPNRYARSLGYLDWDNQPNPFRLYEGAERLPLVREGFPEGPTLDVAYDPSRIESAPVDAASVSRLLFDSLAISAWKQSGDQRWSLRCNPSSGNLHPTEAYPITGPIPGLCDEPTVWHYSPLLHALERRATFADDLLSDGDGLLIGLSSITWREAWKYGERSYRYCQHDVGHAIAALAYAAAALGWHTRMLAGFDDAAIAHWLGLAPPGGPDRVEAEHADVMLFVGPRLPSVLTRVPARPELSFIGEPNLLSESHQDWPVTEQVARACVRTGAVALEPSPRDAAPEPTITQPPARRLFRSRRSAVDMDGVSRLSREAWLNMLARTLPRPGQVPFASLLGRARVHLLLFVHRVDDMAPGLYLLARDRSRHDAIAATLRQDFAWTPVDAGELALPLWQLDLGDTRQAAALVSCRQDIAADGAFAVAMLAELEPTLREHGAWMYRHLHWEAGAIGQVLYLEATAAGLGATGIGCFFDDAVHELLGVGDRSLATIYHFTVGGPVHDSRIQLLDDAYWHLDGEHR